MLTTLVFLVASAKADLGPVVSPGSNRAFHEAVLAVEEQLEAGNFAEAKKLVQLLPSRSIAIVWDDSKVPANHREQYAAGRDTAIKELQLVLGLQVGIEKKGDIRFSFVDSIPANKEEEALPYVGVAHMFSMAPGDPRLDAVIALKRGNPLQESGPIDVHNEVAYAILSYLGVERSLSPLTMSGRTEMPSRVHTKLAPIDGKTILSNLAVREELEKAIEEKKVITPARPAVHLETADIELKPVRQGDPLTFSFALKNTGNAPLALRLVPDCSCLNSSFPPFLDAGRTGLVQANINTYDFIGDLKKRFLVYTNDVDFPLKEVRISVRVEPVARLVSPQSITVLDEKGGTAEVYMFVGPEETVKPTEVRLDGTRAEVSFEPWSGVMADPELNEPEAPRKGYKFTIKFQPHGVPGRVPSTLVVQTDSDRVPTLRSAVYTQNGIVALPSELYFGEMPNEPQSRSFLVSRPGKNFKITKIESSSPNLTATHGPAREGWEHRITVKFDGNALLGKMEAMLTIHTDDPKQPKLMVPVKGTVR